MARPLKLLEHTARRNDILDVALGLVMSKGYERMTVGDIITELGISSGAFYHYFGSKPGVLDAIVARIREESEPALRLVLDDPGLNAIEKLQGFFDVLDALRIERRGIVVELLRVWYSDDNAIVRSRVEAGTRAWRAELVDAIVAEGVADGSFSPTTPARSGEMVMALLHSMGDAHAGKMLQFGHSRESGAALATAVVNIHAAYMTAIERLLGMADGSLRRTDAAAVRTWAKVLEDARL
jgi:AcrR family transcriptional regulator